MDISFTNLRNDSDDNENDNDNDEVLPSEDQQLIRHHVNAVNAEIVIRQLASQGIAFQLWPAASTLLSLLDNHRILHPFLRRDNCRLRLLELGSGTGLVGIAAAAILGADVTVTDLAHVIPNLDFNIAANAEVVGSGGGKLVAAELGWGNVEQMEVIGKGFDVVLGSDLVYHDHSYEPLLETLKYFLLSLGDEEKVFVMAHVKRWNKEAVFFKRARKVFSVDVIHRDPPVDGKRGGVIVYRFVAKPRK
ncbi:uncharacterized protein LOC141643588 [Silene latifolia]|uniref:uncharacterized protein LOC141643588 n=1 Tax=Silene latifolia TaxID=37657 RepID=UPI003D78ABB1